MSEAALIEPDEALERQRKALLLNALSAHTAERADVTPARRAHRWMAWCSLAFAGLSSVALLAVVVEHAPRNYYFEIDNDTGRVSPLIEAKDAPSHFGVRAVRAAIGRYVELRERYIWQMDGSDFQEVALKSFPAEQKRYKEQHDADNLYETYGQNGYRRVIRLLDFHQRADGASTKDKTLEYDVQFVVGEVPSNDPTQTREYRKTAHIQFQFHPELPIAQDDALKNEQGLLVLYYKSWKD